MSKLYKVFLLPNNTAKGNQTHEGFLKDAFTERIGLYTRGDAIKKAFAFKGKIQHSDSARTCDECYKGINAGYCIENGEAYYCSDKCLHKHHTKEDYKKLHDEGNGDSYWTTWESETPTEEKNTLKQVNKALYETLLLLLNSHINNGGTVDFSEKEYSWVSDTLDYVAVKYFNETPDGDYQVELSEDGEPNLTDEEAYIELTTRFNNTTII